jgi:chromatin remodeling complex protein RSC6
MSTAETKKAKASLGEKVTVTVEKTKKQASDGTTVEKTKKQASETTVEKTKKQSGETKNSGEAVEKKEGTTTVVEKTKKQTKKQTNEEVIGEVKPEKKRRTLPSTPPSLSPVPSETSTSSTSTSTRRKLCKEQVEKSFENLLNHVNEELELTKKNEGTTGIRFLKGINKDVQKLKTDCLKLLTKTSRTRVKKDTSDRKLPGFAQPRNVTADMAKFLGISPDTMVSRNDITNAICEYIRKHNLQTAEDRRKFIPDDTLGKLLSCKSSTYALLQRQIQPHFVAKV